MNNDELFNVAAECEIITTRVMQAPRATVFKAWTDAAILQQWWGPAGFTNTFYEFNPVVGGRWKFTMHGPEKGNYQNEAVFLHVVTTFEEVDGGKTKLIFRMQFSSKEACDKITPFAPEKNEENFDKLEVELAKMV
jgi:hypothetical protein